MDVEKNPSPALKEDVSYLLIYYYLKPEKNLNLSTEMVGFMNRLVVWWKN